MKKPHLELSFLTVRALPKASNSGFDYIEMRAEKMQSWENIQAKLI
jgi:hypothetical protein